MYRALVTSSALYGCESWSVKADMQRKLLSQQTQHCVRVLNLQLSRRIQDRISAAEMRKAMGMESVLSTMSYLQLNWLGKVSRMNMNRLPRQMLVSWMPERRLTNYNQTYSRTVKKACEHVGIFEEDDWPKLALDEMEWSHYIRQTAEDRQDLMALYQVTEYEVEEHRLASSYAFSCRVRGRRRSEFFLCGGTFTPLPTNPFLNPSAAVDLRTLDIRNCFEPGRDRDTFGSFSPESSSAQLQLNAGFGGELGVRLSVNGLFFCRQRWESERPSHRYSWMHPSDDEEKGRDPSLFISSSPGPSVPPPLLHRHFATFQEYSAVTAREAAAIPPPLNLGNMNPAVQNLVDHIPHFPQNANPLNIHLSAPSIEAMLRRHVGD
jgi:hypothetical protein